MPSMLATSSTRRPQKVAELRFNTYGFNVGDQVPLFKSHPTFFFYNMEWRSLVQGGVYNQVVPLPSTYGGAFASSLTSAQLHVPCANQLSARSNKLRRCGHHHFQHSGA